MSELRRIVCHRGLHDPDLLDKTRPVENSLGAYEKAWKHFELCECDITSSKDSVLFLCHDETFKRVLEDPFNEPLGDVPVSNLNSEVIEKMVLADGSKPTRLVEVLECAKISGPGKQLVIELKKDAASKQVIKELQAFLVTRGDLVPHVAVIMSFDLEMMTSMAEWRKSLALQKENALNAVKFMILTEAPAHFDPANNTILADVTTPTFKKNCQQLVQRAGLDGVYLEFQEQMISDTVLSVSESKVLDEFSELSRLMPLGVWNYSTTQPDGLVTLSKFAQIGVTFVNSDLPEEEIAMLGLTTKQERESCFDAFWLFCIYGFGR